MQLPSRILVRVRIAARLYGPVSCIQRRNSSAYKWFAIAAHACPLCDRVSKLHLHVGCAPQGVAFPRKAMHCEARAW